VSFGTGCVYSITSISSTFSELESMGTSKTKLTIDIADQNRTLDLEIEESSDKFSYISICDIKLNGHEGKCVIVYEIQEEEIVIPSSQENNSENIVSDLVLSISDPKSQNVLCSGGKGASLGSLYELSESSDPKFVVPKGLIVTSNSYETLLNDSPLILDQIERIEKIAWYVYVCI